MAVRDISPETMVKLSAAWLDPERRRPLLESVPLVAAVLPKIEEAHRALLAAQPSSAPGPLEAKVAAIQETQATVDVLHDRKMRGTIGLLTALADLTDDAAAAARYVQLCDHLCPSGLKGITKSYSDEAGAARMLASRLTAEDKLLLESIPLPEGHLHDAVDAWTRAALKLEKLEDKKTEVERQLAASESVRPADALQARYQWTRAARGLEANLELAEVDAATLEAILGPLHAAARKSDRRKVAKAAPTEVPLDGSAEPADGDG